jgi:hypothetical protein
MPHWLLVGLDIGFFAFHTLLVLFNLLGWIWPRIRRWNLLTLVLTGISWFVMGAWRGIGYCICTDWHHQVRQQLGHFDDPPTYLQLVLKEITGITFDPNLIQSITGLGFAFGIVMSVWVNIRGLKSNFKPPLPRSS